MFIRRWLCYSLYVLLLSSFYHVNGDFETGEQLFGTHRLVEYNSYGDVTLFHSVIPQHSTSARWTFIGLKDNIVCPEVNISIGLQQGSLPITNPYNNSYPPNTNIQSRRQLALFHMKTDQSLILVTTTPEPGDWYVVAFLQKSNDNKIAQQGLGGHDCRYFTQLGLSYQQLRYVPTLSSQTKTVVQLTSQHTYLVYRFYVPSLIKSVTFSYQDCIIQTLVNSTTGDLCPVDVRVRSNYLPGNETKPVDCQSETSCSFPFSQPEGNVWYYVRVDLSSSAVTGLNLSLGVDLMACTDDTLSVNILESESWESTSNNTYSSSQWEHLYNYSSSYDPSSEITPKSTPHLSEQTLVNVISPPLSRLPIPVIQSSPTSASWCPPIVPLSSVQLGSSSPFKVFILITVNSTDGIEVPSDSPVILKFELDSVQDIGGTLSIKAALWTETPDELPEFDNETYVTLCLRRGGIPPLNGTTISCDPAYSVTFNTESSGLMFPWNTPFPQPGIWYLSLESLCKSETGMGRCNTTVFVTVDIGLYACIDGCGTYGVCHSAVDTGIMYYFCKCSRGYEGWGCSDASNAWSESYFLSRVLLLTLSNVFFVFPCLLALKRHHFVPAVSYFCTLLFSSFYHACDSGSLCIMKYDTLQFCDFFAAFMAIFLTLITMARLPTPLKSVLEILGAFGLALGTSYNRFSIWVVGVPVGAGVAVLLISWSRRCYKRRHCYPTTKWRWLCFILPGIAVIITGLCIFAFLETTNNYQYVHSAWHVAMAIGVLFLLPPRERPIVNERTEAPLPIQDFTRSEIYQVFDDNIYMQL